MSKIGKLPIQLPAQVSITLEADQAIVKGAKGELVVPIHSEVAVVIEDGQALVTRKSETKLAKSLHGLTRSLLANAVDGVTIGFTKTLEINGVGFRAEMKGADVLVLNIGFSHPVEVPVLEGVEVKTDKNQIIVTGLDKQRVGQMAAVIRAHKKPEPYKGKGIKYSDEVIKRKAGKTAKA